MGEKKKKKKKKKYSITSFERDNDADDWMYHDRCLLSSFQLFKVFADKRYLTDLNIIKTRVCLDSKATRRVGWLVKQVWRRVVSEVSGTDFL